MSHRDATAEDFIGKTIVAVNVEAANIWRFWFSDGTAFAVETEGDGMIICDECIDLPSLNGDNETEGQG